MHQVDIIKENALGLKPGGRYLAEDVNAGEMLSNGWCKVLEPNARCADLPVYYLDEADFPQAKILFVRPGGFGDLLFLTPTFRELKKRWLNCEITVACFQRYHEILRHNPDVDGFIDYPVQIEKWCEFSAQVWLENIIEDNEKAKKKHAVDLIWERVAGDELGELTDKRMRYVVTDEELAKAKKDFPRINGMNRVGLQMGFNQSNLLRMYPKMPELSKRLWRDGYEVFLFGRPGDMKTNEPDGIVNLMTRNKTLREQMAILSTCDCVVAPDSVLCHVAGALDIPCVALYGPFPWQLRTAYAENTFALQGICPVSPCFHHVRPGRGLFPEYGPCAESGKCEALDLIRVDRIVREVEKRLSLTKPKSKEIAA